MKENNPYGAFIHLPTPPNNLSFKFMLYYSLQLLDILSIEVWDSYN